MTYGISMTWKTDIDEGKALCHFCGHLQDVSEHECQQCGGDVHQRMPSSLALTWAYVITATLFLIPANLMPMMVVTALGTDEGSTIIEGVMYFFHHAEYALGGVIFIASVAVPVFKLYVIYYLLYIAQFKKHNKAKQGLKLFHLIHIIGKWSMLDIFVVALMVSMVQFQDLATIRTGGAAIAFVLAVVFTIIASEKFDPRLLRDTKKEETK